MHSIKEFLCFVFGNVTEKSQFAKCLIRLLYLKRRSDDDFIFAAVQNAVIMKIRCNKVANVGIDGKNFVSESRYRVFR